MEKHLDKKLEQICKKMMREVEVDKPSMDFTAHVMQNIHELDANKVTNYKPLITKPTWVVLGLVLILATIYIALTTGASNVEWFNKLDFSFWDKSNFINSLSSITLPKTFTYAVALFCIMLCIQIPFLKHYFNKRLDL